jgi:CheY-like chemotaxis protein
LRPTPDQVGADPEMVALTEVLRAEAVAAAPPEVVEPAETPRVRAGPAPDGPAVLLVEDSPTVRMLQTMLLSDAGFAVDAVDDGKEALDRALSRPYRLLVTAVEVRGLRGLDLAESIRRSPFGRRLPIIVMSSDDNPEHRRRAAAIGVQAYIRKGSFGRQRLVETAQELVSE